MGCRINNMHLHYFFIHDEDTVISPVLLLALFLLPPSFAPNMPFTLHYHCYPGGRWFMPWLLQH